MAEISQHPFDTVVLQDAALASEDLDLDIDIDLDMDIADGAGTHPSPIVESEASIHDDEELIDIEDVVLVYKGLEYPCNAQTLMQGSKVLSETLQDYDASQFRPQVCNVPTFSECDSPEVFYATLEVWLIGHHFGIDTMKDIAVTKAASVTEKLTKYFIQLSESHERECERAHLASLTRAVKLANRHEWHAALWKMLYDAGEAVAPKLLCHPSFESYIKTDEGQDYARAIRVSDRVKHKVEAGRVEAGRGRGNGGVTKRPASGGRRGRKVFGRGQRLSWQ